MGYAQRKNERDILQDQQDQAENALAALREERTVGGEFLAHESLSSEATDFGRSAQAQNDDRYRNSAPSEGSRSGSTSSSNSESYAYQEEEEQVPSPLKQMEIYKARKQSLQKAHLQKKVATKIAQSSLGSIMGVTGAWSAYFFQFLFAAISLVFIGAKGVFESSTVLKLGAKFIGLFFDIQSLAPLEMMMMAFWGLSTIVAVGTFIAFLIWFVLTGEQFFETTRQKLMTALAFTFSILPVFNLFPWIPLWVLLVNVRSVLMSAKELFRD
jgi:hypothetical protein